jgi:hypothetical protein
MCPSYDTAKRVQFFQGKTVEKPWTKALFFLCFSLERPVAKQRVFPLCLSRRQTEEKTERETKSFTKKPLWISTFDQRQSAFLSVFPLCFTSWKDTKEKPFVLPLVFPKKNKGKTRPFSMVFPQFFLGKTEFFLQCDSICSLAAVSSSKCTKRVNKKKRASATGGSNQSSDSDAIVSWEMRNAITCVEY